jgi:hypothetical protein
MATVVGPLTAAERRSLHFAPRTLAPSAPVVCYAPCGGEFVYPMHLPVQPHMPAQPAQPESPRAVPPLTFRFAGELTAPQQTTTDALERSLRARRAALCELPTGAGKTVVALALASRLGVRVLVVVHTRILLDQWLARIGTFLGETAAVVCGDARDGPATRITVGMLQTLRLRPTPHDADYGLVVYDEVHHMCARAFSRVMLRIRPRYALGLSATVARTDGLETVLYAFFGAPAALGLLGPLGAARKSRAARVEPLALGDFGVVPHSAYNPALRRACVVVSRLVSDLAASAARTRVIVEKCASMCAAGRRVLVLSHRRAHCEEMHAALRARGIDAALVLGGSAAQRLEGHAAVVGTVAAVSEGFDEPWLDTLLLATPMVSVVQAVGRILRRDHDALVVDAVDVAIPTCRSQHRRRCAAYRAAGHSVAAMAPMAPMAAALPDGALADEAVRAPRRDLEGDDGARTLAQVERERAHAVDPEHRPAEPRVASCAARDNDAAVPGATLDELAGAARRVHGAVTRPTPRRPLEPRAGAVDQVPGPERETPLLRPVPA